MTRTPTIRRFELRHVQLARAAFAAIAALMVTFSSDHSAMVGLSVFSGFALVSGLVLLAAAWLVYGAGTRWPAAAMGAVSVLAGLAAGIAPLRSDTMFFVVVIGWALATGALETVAAVRARRAASERPRTDAARTAARDGLTVGILTLVFGVALLFVPGFPALQYTIAEADATFVLTAIIIGVGLLGGYAAILAVYLAIAGLSPRRPAEPAEPTLSAPDHERGSA